MTEPTLSVTNPGPLSTIQDLGRNGYQRFGVSVSGAADAYALRLGNLLVGNDQRAAAIEVTLGGAEFEFTAQTTFAITGADLSPALNGAPVALWETVEAGPGDVLTLPSPAAPGAGLRAYLNLSGGIDTPPALGSRSTHPGAGLGGVDGRALASGDSLPVGPVTNPVAAGRRIPAGLLPQYGDDVTLRVIPGPQDDRFASDARKTFYSSAYTVTDRSDRMGCRLDGPEVPAIDGAHDIVSDGVVTGAIQIPGDARPIILLADRQTTGGYAKIGVIAGVDLGLAAQATPGSTIRFQETTADEAAALSRERFASLRDIEFESATIEEPGDDDQRFQYELRIGGSDYRVDISPTGPGGRSTVNVNGVEYGLTVESGE